MVLSKITMLEAALIISGNTALRERVHLKVWVRMEAVNKFLEKNDLLSVIRAHEAQIDG